MKSRNHRQHQGEPPIEEIPVGWNSVRRVCMNVDRVYRSRLGGSENIKEISSVSLE